MQNRADIVERNNVIVDASKTLRTERHPINKKSGAIVYERIVHDLDVIRILKAERIAAGTALPAQHILTHNQVVRVHRIDTDRIVKKTIAFDDRTIAVHQMRAIPSMLDQVVAQMNVGRIPDDDIARAMNVILRDGDARRVPQSDSVALASDFILGLA